MDPDGDTLPKRIQVELIVSGWRYTTDMPFYRVETNWQGGNGVDIGPDPSVSYRVSADALWEEFCELEYVNNYGPDECARSWEGCSGPPGVDVVREATANQAWIEVRFKNLEYYSGFEDYLRLRVDWQATLTGHQPAMTKTCIRQHWPYDTWEVVQNGWNEPIQYSSYSVYKYGFWEPYERLYAGWGYNNDLFRDWEENPNYLINHDSGGLCSSTPVSGSRLFRIKDFILRDPLNSYPVSFYISPAIIQQQAEYHTQWNQWYYRWRYHEPFDLYFKLTWLWKEHS